MFFIKNEDIIQMIFVGKETKKEGMYMKKLLTQMMLFCVMVVFLFTNVSAIVSYDNDYSSFGYAFQNVGQTVLEDYQNGKFGEEVYYLASFGGWSGRGDIAIFQKENIPTLVWYESAGRYKERTLGEEEYQSFLQSIQDNKMDELPNWDTALVMDGIEYEYMHFTKDKIAAVYMNNPESSEEENGQIYCLLVQLFWDLTQTEEFQVAYDVEGVELLIRNEDYKVQSVWKNQDDFRVCIRDEQASTYDYSKLDWYAFKDNKISHVIQEPEGITLQHAWDDDPKVQRIVDGNLEAFGDYTLQEHYNNYPWQVEWNGYRVRVMESYNNEIWGNGLWLTKMGEKPVLIHVGNYNQPVVIPNTDWVVCEKATDGWQNPRTLVKINLNTFEEYEIDFAPSEQIEPMVVLDGKLLISCITQEKSTYYLYDVETDTAQEVYGDFRCFFWLGSHFLQPTSEPGKYYALKDQFTLGIFDIKNYTFTELFHSPVLIYDNDHMWVDEENAQIYVVLNQDLIALPVNLDITGETTIEVTLNGTSIPFDQPPIMQNDRVLVPIRKVLEALGANVIWYEEKQLIFLVKGQNIIFIPLGEAYFSMIDVSAYETIYDFNEVLDNYAANGNMESIINRYPFDVLPQMVNNRTLVPVRAICEALGVNVEWEENTVKLSCSFDFLTERNKSTEFVNLLIFYEEYICEEVI